MNDFEIRQCDQGHKINFETRQYDLGQEFSCTGHPSPKVTGFICRVP